jgi:undecaprenyl-phosphate 4-deoxy-4-formamido-L-arabinose transferase
MIELPAPLIEGISVVTPVYNSASNLDELLKRLAPALDALGLPYEVVLINDGSRDDSWAVICRLQEAHAWVRAVNLMRNYGQHNALLCGVRMARYATVVTLDDDLQHPPEEIHRLIEQMQQGCDVVYGTPIHQQHTLWRNLASYFTRLALQSTMGLENARKVSAFRAFRTQIRNAFVTFNSPFVILDVLLSWGAAHFGVVPVQHHARKRGASNYTFRMLLIHAVNMVTGFTVLPLQLASWMGFGFGLFGLVVLIYVIGRYVLQGGSVPGFPFLASIIAIFSGVQLFALGIIGEYLARIHFRIMEKPSYVIREVADSPAEDSI